MVKETFPKLSKSFRLNPDGLINNLLRKGTPDRVYFLELFQDKEVENIIDEWFGVTSSLNHEAKDYGCKRAIAMQRFLGYEYVSVDVLSGFTYKNTIIHDTMTGSQARKQRGWREEHQGPITSWEEFEKYPWPDPTRFDTSALEWYEKNLPDDMFIMGRAGHFCENLCWLMGYESFCYALYEQPDLVSAIFKKVMELEEAACKVLLQCPRVKVHFASDDLGFKTGPMVSPGHLRQYVFPGHKRLAELNHKAGRPYLLHACGNRREILEDLIEDVKIDGIHSWEDVIEPICDAKVRYGNRLSLLGGIDVDFLCRADEKAIRKRVRETVHICQPGGGFCLGSGNSVANYIPAENYLAMLDEGRKC